jgi:hypothetical protein
MENTRPASSNVLRIFRLLNIGSVALWFFYTKSTVGTPVFPLLVALHALATWGFAFFWYRDDSRNARWPLIVVLSTLTLFMVWFFFGRR